MKFFTSRYFKNIEILTKLIRFLLISLIGLVRTVICKETQIYLLHCCNVRLSFFRFEVNSNLSNYSEVWLELLLDLT